MRINLHGLGQDDSGVDLSNLPLGGETSLPVDIPVDVSSLPLSVPGLNPTTGSYQPAVPITSGLPGGSSSVSLPGLSPAQLSTLGVAAGGAVPTSLQAQAAAQVASSTVNAANSMNYVLMAGVVVMVIFGISAMAKGR